MTEDLQFPKGFKEFAVLAAANFLVLIFTGTGLDILTLVFLADSFLCFLFYPTCFRWFLAFFPAAFREISPYIKKQNKLLPIDDKAVKENENEEGKKQSDDKDNSKNPVGSPVSGNTPNGSGRDSKRNGTGSDSSESSADPVYNY